MSSKPLSARTTSTNRAAAGRARTAKPRSRTRTAAAEQAADSTRRPAAKTAVKAATKKPSVRKSADLVATDQEAGGVARKPVEAEAPLAAPVAAAEPAAEPVLELPALCTIHQAAEFKQQLLAALDIDAAVVVNAAGLERIDTAGVQLLAVFVRDRRDSGRDVRWQGASEALERAAGLLGVQTLLNLPDTPVQQRV